MVIRLAAEFARQGHDVRVVFHSVVGSQDRIDAMIRSLPGADAVKCQPIPAPVGAEKFLVTQTRRQLAQLLADVQIVHLHGVWDSILKASATVAFRLGIPYVVTPHGMLDPWSLSQKKWKKKLALALGYRAMLNRAAFLHVLNRDEIELLKPLGLTSPMQMIPNGITPDEFLNLPTPGTFRASHPQLGSSPYILFLSRLHYKKGLDILADAFGLLAGKNPGVHLVVAGPDEGAATAFKNQIKSAGLENRVHLTGPIFGDEKLAALVDAACFCLPSRQEGFSLAILEAMACGVPVVISTECHFPEVAEQKAGEIVPLSAAAFATALEKVVTNPGERGKAGQAMVFEQFTWPKVVGMLVEAYKKHQPP
jgi:glycosyltransferase involved in cell wall biosynthesis